ncbi:MAG: ABC transporter ATP-binding protein/permease [Bacteroidales bacterium]|nr:ABC transporter ATP-binding protein/permease [Bacteroidales bacterium]
MVLLAGLFNRMLSVNTERLKLKFDKFIGFKMLNMDYSDLESHRVQELKLAIDQSKLRSGGISKIIELYGRIAQNIISLVLAVGSFLAIFQMRNVEIIPSFWNSHWPLMFLLLLSIILFIWSGRMQVHVNSTITSLDRSVTRANGGAFMFMQMMNNYRFGKDIRIYGLGNFLCDSFDKLWKSPIGQKLMGQLGRKRALVPCTSAVINVFLALMAYILALYKAINGEITLGSVILYAGSIQVFIKSVSSLFQSFGDILGCCDLMLPYLELLHIPNCENADSAPAPKALSFHTIEFNNVSFRYPNTDAWALHDVTFKINLHERVVAVGMNGSGKTTMVKLLCRLYKPSSGRILLDGVDITNIDIDSYRSLFAVVFQDFKLFSFSVGENIAVCEHFNDDRVWESLDKAGIAELVRKYPNKLNTPVYQDYASDGVEVSGGESQRIAIARAFYKDAPILIMDEPTAALDPKAEFQIYESVNNAVADKTILYISHRLSSCRFCNKILVFHDGEIVQTGSHEELLEQKTGRYWELWHAQAQFYQPNLFMKTTE